jgi:hypothetical protein
VRQQVGAAFWTVLVAALAMALSAQQLPVPPAVPVEPIARMVAAFQTHRVVTISDPHGNVQVQAFILSLIRDRRFREVVDDIVLETTSARYQDVIDRFVRGEDVPRAVLRHAWEDHTVANSFGRQAAELIDAVRAANGEPGVSRKLRVVAGDPPIDWENIGSEADHAHWISLRDSYPADIIRRQVIERGRRALVIYGQGHLQRRQVASNYDMTPWEAQTVVSLIERDAGIRVFNIWTWLDREVELNELASWPIPALAAVSGTVLGQRDFGAYARGLLGGNRFAVKDGQIVPITRDQWKSLRMEEQFDAVLYLGSPANMTVVGVSPDLCRDAPFVSERLRRLALVGPPPELAAFKKACGL